MIPALFVAGILGLFAGSFLGVVLHRVPRNASIVQPPSFCWACGTPLRWYDNLPLIGFLLLRGRCRDCETPIGHGAWLMECATAALAMGVTALVLNAPNLAPSWAPNGPWALGVPLLILLAFAAAALVLTIIDFQHLIMPDEITLPLALASPLWALGTGLHRRLGWDVAQWFVVPNTEGTVWSLNHGLQLILGVSLGAAILLPLSNGFAFWVLKRFSGPDQQWTEADFRGLKVTSWILAISIALPALLSVLLLSINHNPGPVSQAGLDLAQGALGTAMGIWMLHGIGLIGTLAFRRNAMGLGDVKLQASLGALLGPIGILVSFSAAIFLAVIAAGVTMLWRLHKDFDREIPFGPWLLSGAAVTLIWGQDLMTLVRRLTGF